MAEQKIGTLFWEIEADTKKFDKGAKKTEKQVKTLGQKFSNLGKIITTGFAVAAVAGIAKVSKELILAASDAEETRNKFDVVFRDIAIAAEESATDLSTNFGLSSTAARTLLSDTGDLLTGFGFTQESALDLSTEVNKLAVDLASFTNFSGGAEGASQALTKALLGERESVKALGISILDVDVKAKVLENTQAGLTFETERQAKAFATLQIAQEQSQNAIGDFARSSESFANQQRIAAAAVDDLSVALGQNLLPIATQMTTVFGNLTRAFADAVTEANNVNSVIKDLGDGTLDAEVSLQTLTDTLARLTAEKIAGSALGYRRGLDEELAKVTALIEAYGIQDLFLIKNKESKDALARSTEDLARTEEERSQLALEEEAQRLIALNEYLDLVNDEYAQTEQGKIDLLQQQIEMWEEYAETAVNTLPKVTEILEALRDQMEEMTETNEETFSDLIGSDDEWTEAYIENLDRQREADDALAAHRAELAVAEELLNQQRLAAATNLFSGLSELFAAAGIESRGLLIAQKAASAISAGINSGVAFTKTLVDGGPFPINVIAAAGVLASGIAQQIKILSTPIPAFAKGGDFVTNGPQAIMVGDNPGGRERVQVTPMGSPNVNGPGSVPIHVTVILNKKPILDVVRNGNRTGQLVLETR